MIEIISHRGLWRKPFERNSLASLRSSIDEGFGLETDVRDLNGDLVISHDMPTGSDENVTLDELLRIYCSSSCNLTLALNVKSDGLSSSIKEQLQKYKIENYFVFDMSVPDTLSYKNEGLNYFTRQSEYETEPVLYHEACGVWLDEFQGHWIGRKEIQQHIKKNKKICIVSPELHNRKYEKEWNHYKEIEQQLNITNLMICTDYPELAQEFFNEK